MKINAKLLSIALMFAVIISLVWGNRECTSKQHYEDLSVTLRDRIKADSVKFAERADKWEKDSVKLIGVVVSLKQQINDAKAIASDFKIRYEGAVMASDRQAEELSYRAKQISLLRSLVGNKTLSPDYLNKPDFVAVADTSVLTATVKTVKRAEVAEKSLDSLVKATATQTTELQRQREQSRKDREASLYAEGRLRKLAQRKPLFSKSRRKQADEDADDVAKVRDNGISDLEKLSNKIQ